MTILGLYLRAPHGRLIYTGTKKAVAVAKRLPIEGDRLICSKENGVGYAFGIAHVGQPATLDITSFDKSFDVHQVSKACREKWWRDADHLYSYPLLRFVPFPEPREVDILPGTTMDMGEVKFIDEAVNIDKEIKMLSKSTFMSSTPLTPTLNTMSPSIPADSTLVTSPPSDTIPLSTPSLQRGIEQTDSSHDVKEELTETESKEEDKPMPYTVADPPRPAKNWTKAEKEKCVTAANAVLKDDPENEKGAIFACIRAAGKTKHPGGKSFHPHDYVAAEELVSGFILLRDVDLKAGDDGHKAGDEGDGEVKTCTCANCKADHDAEPDMSCRDTECPDCGAAMRGGGGDEEPEEKMIVEDDKGSFSLKDWAENWITRFRDLVSPPTQRPYSIKSLGTDSEGQSWFEIWPTNAYKDLEDEFFTTASIHDFVKRKETDEIKGEAWYRHVPGSKFGTIRHQAVVADHFLVQLGTFDHTPIGNAFKEFFSRFPDGHPVIAPNGWGASHGYKYQLDDRLQDGVYNWFDIGESSVLPVELAANPYNPPPFKEAFNMNDKEYADFDAVGKSMGIENFADLIIKEGENMRKTLDGDEVEHKSVEPTEQVQEPEDKSLDEGQVAALVNAVAQLVGESKAADKPKPKPDEEEDEEEEKPKEKKEQVELENVPPEVVVAIANQVVAQLQPEALSKMLKDHEAAIKALQEQNNSTQSTLDELAKSEEQKLAAQMAIAPQFHWFQASKAAETVLDEKDKTDATLKASKPSGDIPPAVGDMINQLNIKPM